MKEQTITQRIGVIRLTLLFFVAACLLMAPFSDAKPVGFGVITAYIAPTLVILFFFILMLDVLMNRVFMIEQADNIQQRHRFLIRVNLLSVGLICVVWGPFFYHLINDR